MTYDNDNRVTGETDQYYSSGVLSSTTVTTNYYGLYNAATQRWDLPNTDQGVIMESKGVVTAAGSSSSTTTKTFYTYQWWDQAQQLKIQINATDPSNPNTGSWAAGYSNLTYDANGHLTQLIDSGGNRQVNYVDDAYGQVMMREEKATNVSAVFPPSA